MTDVFYNENVHVHCTSNFLYTKVHDTTRTSTCIHTIIQHNLVYTLWNVIYSAIFTETTSININLHLFIGTSSYIHVFCGDVQNTHVYNVHVYVIHVLIQNININVYLITKIIPEITQLFGCV